MTFKPATQTGFFVLFLTLTGAIALPACKADEACRNGQLVRGPTYEGVIFTTEMLPRPTKNYPAPSVAAVDTTKKVTYWKPSAELIQQAEKAFASAVNKAAFKFPTHDRDYYAPKYYSRDLQPQLPDDFQTNFLYSIPPETLTPHAKRQYVGVTVAGKKMLLMNLVYNETFISDGDLSMFKDWKHEWMYIEDAGCQIFYDLKTGTFSEVDT